MKKIVPELILFTDDIRIDRSKADEVTEVDPYAQKLADIISWHRNHLSRMGQPLTADTVQVVEVNAREEAA